MVPWAMHGVRRTGDEYGLITRTSSSCPLPCGLCLVPARLFACSNRLSPGKMPTLEQMIIMALMTVETPRFYSSLQLLSLLERMEHFLKFFESFHPLFVPLDCLAYCHP